MKHMLELFLIFAKVGVMTFGGGYAMLPILQREIVENRGWATEEELADYFAVGQCTPGIIAVNTATFVGQKQAGTLGGIVATLGVVFPSLVIISILSGFIDAHEGNLYVQEAFRGIRVCVCVLIFNAVCKLWKSSVHDRLTLAIFLVVTIAALLIDVSPIVFVVAVALLGIGIQTYRVRAVRCDASPDTGAGSSDADGGDAGEPGLEACAAKASSDDTSGGDAKEPGSDACAAKAGSGDVDGGDRS